MTTIVLPGRCDERECRIVHDRRKNVHECLVADRHEETVDEVDRREDTPSRDQRVEKFVRALINVSFALRPTTQPVHANKDGQVYERVDDQLVDCHLGEEAAHVVRSLREAPVERAKVEMHERPIPYGSERHEGDGALHVVLSAAAAD
eukprot:CAMPEP_0204153412 /NCGR_PEP_ID=MMETSP0361-20130328/27831_1 /ASSEMBLY_ACC=CAM_ASM_000343 /TAXON_ID=268821 /ORGANISM="Scrippsiella Hangoei, Strain SHTV-5" /LENGTH=147 /DNA_ID=CAMNT_0051108535 /DNA_START=113 /DNA_END=554 /DNA_ORIENTATION=+